MHALVRESVLKEMAHGPVKEYAEVLDHDQKLELDFPVVDKVFPVARAVQPDAGSAEEGKIVSGTLDYAFPSSEKFFQQIGVDLLVTIWKFLHRGDLCEFLSLMLTSRCIYRRLREEKELLFQIAKESFTFIYLSDLRQFFCLRNRSFSELLQYAAPTHGAELGYNQWNGSSKQFLKNRKLLKQPNFSITLIVKPIECNKLYILAKCKLKHAKRLMNLLQEFEEAHNAIAMKIYKPRNDHYPLSMHNLNVRIKSTLKSFLHPEKSKIWKVVCRVSFSVQYNLRYSFALWATQWQPLPS